MTNRWQMVHNGLHELSYKLTHTIIPDYLHSIFEGHAKQEATEHPINVICVLPIIACLVRARKAVARWISENT
jgi:hypothetical protein